MNQESEISSKVSDSLKNSNHKFQQNSNKTNNLEKLISNNYSKQSSINEISSTKKNNKNKKKEQILEEIVNLNNKIKKNDNDINKIKTQLINLRKEKKEKKEDVINLLSNKESLEELYKNKIYFLINKEHIINENNDDNMNKMLANNDNINVELTEIKESEQNKFIEQINNMVNDIFQRHDDKICNEIINIINSSYQTLNENHLENNDDLIVKDFFSRISLYISNQSLGKFQESEINILLSYLLQINTISQKLEKYIKFVNKKYKEQKKELNNSINGLEKIKKILFNKKTDLENQLKEYEEKVLNNSNNYSSSEKENINMNIINRKENKIIYSKKYISPRNNFFRKSQRNGTKENTNMKDIIIHNEEIENQYKTSSINKKMKNEIIDSNNIDDIKRENIINPKIEKIMIKNDNQLNQDGIIEYEDGIEKNVNNNNEEDINNLYNHKKENELINRGISPYTKEIISKNKNEEEKKGNKNRDFLKKEREENIENNNKGNNRKFVNIVHLKEKRKIDRKSLLRKINDYTFNISINNNNKNIFTENNSKNNNIQNMNDKILINNANQINKIDNHNKIKNELSLSQNIRYNRSDKKENEEIITYKISSINKNELQGISNSKVNKNEIQKENIIQNYNSNILRGSNDYNNFSSKNIVYTNDNCLTNNDDKNHNYISIINITNNAPMQNKQMAIVDDEKICNIDNFDNENGDELKINTMKIKNKILNEINENKNFDINNNNVFLDKENKEINYITKNNINAIQKKSDNSKRLHKIDIIKFNNKNSSINDINERSLKNKKNLSLNLASLNNTNYLPPKIIDSNQSEENQIFNENNTLSPIKKEQNQNKNKNDFFHNVNSSILKVTKTKEVNIKEIKNNKINILNKTKLSKTINLIKQLPKLSSNSRDKIHILHKKINSINNRINEGNFNEINDKINEKEDYEGFYLNKINKNNLSLDRLDLNNNKTKLKDKLSSNIIKKLKLINVPISKNQNLKTEYETDKIKDYLNKNINAEYSFYKYINNSSSDNKNITMTKQSICFYRIYYRNNEKLNINENLVVNIENIGFSKGYISINLKSDFLQFIPKINNNNEILIILKNIIGVQIEQEMQNIINELVTIENDKDNKKIKNDIFIFNLLISDFEEGKIECAFNNFEIYMFWMKFLEQIAEYYRNCKDDFNI